MAPIRKVYIWMFPSFRVVWASEVLQMVQFAQIQTTNSEHGQFGRQALQKADVSKCLRETEKFFRSREGWEVPGDLDGGITTNPLGISQKNGMVYDASQMM